MTEDPSQKELLFKLLGDNNLSLKDLEAVVVDEGGKTKILKKGQAKKFFSNSDAPFYDNADVPFYAYTKDYVIVSIDDFGVHSLAMMPRNPSDKEVPKYLRTDVDRKDLNYGSMMMEIKRAMKENQMEWEGSTLCYRRGKDGVEIIEGSGAKEKLSKKTMPFYLYSKDTILFVEVDWDPRIKYVPRNPTTKIKPTYFLS